jgi:hypothetical protein
MIIFCLVHCYTEFAPYIIFKLVVIAVKMIFSNVGKYRYIRSECFDIIQLETADLCYIQRFGICCNLSCE